jgi:hypothetical protein
MLESLFAFVIYESLRAVLAFHFKCGRALLEGTVAVQRADTRGYLYVPQEG